jgi:hypothetical protein
MPRTLREDHQKVKELFSTLKKWSLATKGGRRHTLHELEIHTAVRKKSLSAARKALGRLMRKPT